MHILFVTATRIGDAVLSTGLLVPCRRTLSRRAPDHRRGAGRRAAVRGSPRARAGAGHGKAARRRCIGWRSTPAPPPAAGTLSSICAARRSPGCCAPASAGSWPRAMPASTGCASSARLFGLDPPPGPGIWTAPRHERAAEALLPPGRAGAGDRAGRQLARQAMACRALCRAGAASRPPPTGRCRARASRCWRRRMSGPGGAAALGDAVPPGGVIDLVGRTDLLTAAAVLRRSRNVHRQRHRADAYRRGRRHADPGPVRAEPGRAICAVGALHRLCPHEPAAESHVRAGLRPPHHRYADGQPFGRDGRGGCSRAVAPRRNEAA